jgi:hypothetical protein
MPISALKTNLNINSEENKITFNNKHNVKNFFIVFFVLLCNLKMIYNTEPMKKNYAQKSAYTHYIHALHCNISNIKLK